MYNTTGIKYLGSKSSFLTIISDAIDKLLDNNKRETIVIDMFSGSTRVAQMARQRGFKTLTSDILPACIAYSQSFIQSDLRGRDTLSTWIDELNQVEPTEGWISTNYGEAPPSVDNGSGKLVNAFTNANAMKADAIRDLIEELRPDISENWYYVLITSLILAMNEVQNSQGHQRAWFRDFQRSALNPLTLTLPPVLGDPEQVVDMANEEFIAKYPKGAHFVGDVLTADYAKFVQSNSADDSNIIAYIDPPYTTNLDYNQFYHLWDSVVLWDKPETIGATNRRSDRDSKREGGAAHSSTFAKRKYAENSFRRLFDSLTYADGIIVSYSSDSIVDFDTMCSMIEDSGFGLLDVNGRQYNRHALSKAGTASEETKATARKHNTEWTFCAKRKS